MFGLEERDIHIIKYFSAQVMISGGRVIEVTEPTMMSCPLAQKLYSGFKGAHSNDKAVLKQAIQGAIESKIKDFGLFTGERNLICHEPAIPYGASEMMMYALQRGAIGAAVVVCEGAGTVITDRPEVVQGIGARLNSIVVTTPIRGIQKELKRLGCLIASKKGMIDQVRGVEEAIKLGYKKIAVTVSGAAAGELRKIREKEKRSGVGITTLAVCTTGVADDRIEMMKDHADLVWACASSRVREKLGPLAKRQLARQIPVYVLSDRGIDFIEAILPDLPAAARRRACPEGESGHG
ncbi:MAG: DUF2099 family protein [Candidatus Saganbacteria bacterium]|nr:DUF2099 family protein [Candidatus Saganbacteria bacterium]